MQARTDLALEAKRLWDRNTGEKTALNGVKAFRTDDFGAAVDVVRILDREGEEALGKPAGTYLTMELEKGFYTDRGAFEQLTKTLAAVLRSLLPNAQRPMVVGLGNREITPDSIGPRVLDHLLITRHLSYAGLGDLCAVEPGVLAATGIESLQLVRGAVSAAEPDCVIVADALASGEPQRLCGSVQITDTGIVPGSGVHNSRQEFSCRTLGVPVVAVGVPTVCDHGGTEDGSSRLILSVADIDLRAVHIAKLIGYGVDLFIHSRLSTGDLPWLLA